MASVAIRRRLRRAAPDEVGPAGGVVPVLLALVDEVGLQVGDDDLEAHPGQLGLAGQRGAGEVVVVYDRASPSMSACQGPSSPASSVEGLRVKAAALGLNSRASFWLAPESPSRNW